MFEAASNKGLNLPSSGGLYFDTPRGQAYNGARAGSRMCREIQAAWASDVALLQGRLADLVAPVHHATISLSAGIELGDQGEPLQDVTPSVMSYEIEADGISLIRMSRRRDGYLQLDRLDHEHPVFRSVIRAIVETATTTEALSTTD